MYFEVPRQRHIMGLKKTLLTLGRTRAQSLPIVEHTIKKVNRWKNWFSLFQKYFMVNNDHKMSHM